MKKLAIGLLCACMLFAGAWAEESETVVALSDDEITVNGQAISEDAGEDVYLAYQVETHEDVPEALIGLSNRVVTITESGSYRFSGAATDLQIAVRAETDDAVRVILDGVSLTCRTAPCIAGYSAFDPRVAGEYGLTIELAEGSENVVTGSHTCETEEGGIEFDGAIGSAISLGFEGTGGLTVNADKEGVEVSSGHLTINGGTLHIDACDDPLNVAEDGFGVLTMNGGYLYSAVRPVKGGEGDGVDSNGYIVFNGGTAINLAHPTSKDSGIDSDLGSSINGGVVVGAGNMYDAIDDNSEQLFMMLEFTQETDGLVVVADSQGAPVFAYDFPYAYKYIAFSVPELREGEVYRVYLGGEIEGVQQDGLYTDISSYTPGTLMQHGGEEVLRAPDSEGKPDGGMGAAPGMDDGRKGLVEALERVDLNEVLADVDLNALLEGKDLNQLLTGFRVDDLLTQEQIAEYFGDADVTAPEMGRGMGGPMEMQPSADTATSEFVLSSGDTEFTHVSAAQE